MDPVCVNEFRTNTCSLPENETQLSFQWHLWFASWVLDAVSTEKKKTAFESIFAAGCQGWAGFEREVGRSLQGMLVLHLHQSVVSGEKICLKLHVWKKCFKVKQRLFMLSSQHRRAVGEERESRWPSEVGC